VKSPKSMIAPPYVARRWDPMAQPFQGGDIL
jgi:hypothetical protein